MSKKKCFLTSHPALIVKSRQYSLFTPDGELLNLNEQETLEQLKNMLPPMVVHTPMTKQFLKNAKILETSKWLDLLEFAAFVFPAKLFGPNARMLAQTLGITTPSIIEADFLFEIAHFLGNTLKQEAQESPSESLNALAAILYNNHWSWGPIILDLLGLSLPLPSKFMQPSDSLKVWRRLPKWEESPSHPFAQNHPVEPVNARRRLLEMLGPQAENRIGQMDFTDVACFAFEPCQQLGHPHVVLAEAATGTGKTLAYIAPASLWAENNHGTVWINTYTKHLQRQIEGEMQRLYPNPKERLRHVVIRKGRENYLCLLNMEEIIRTLPQHHPTKKNNAPLIALALLTRWAEKTIDGDLLGGDLPSWFFDLFDSRFLLSLAERRGECIYSACPHYQQCFVEHSIRKAQDATLVVANHALVMTQIYGAGQQIQKNGYELNLPTRYIFDESHHLLEAADKAYQIALSGLETSELRRWLLGAENTTSRSRGLKKRIEDLIIGDSILEKYLNESLLSAHALPSASWPFHLSMTSLEHSPEEQLHNPTELFLYYIRQQILEHPSQKNQLYQGREGILQKECELYPVLPQLSQAAQSLGHAFSKIITPLQQFVNQLIHKLKKEEDTLSPIIRDRMEILIISIQRRALTPLTLWKNTLDLLNTSTLNSETSTHISFLRLTQSTHNKTEDIGLYSHWLDPMIPFIKNITPHAHGIIMTSATLRDDGNGNTETSWKIAERQTGATHLPTPALRAALSCPFDYAQQAKIYIVTDILRNSIESLANAYQALFIAARGGGLGLFTAITRLKEVYRHIALPLQQADIPLFAQHIDSMNHTSLIELFRNEKNSCLLGTDAMRDGIDVPGDALRLVVFERTPWPRPDILHQHRRKYFSKESPLLYDEQVVRLKLRQAFGRLIRNQTDRGLFIMLDRRTPSRLLSAFPKEVPIQKLSLKDTIQAVHEFFLTHSNRSN